MATCDVRAPSDIIAPFSVKPASTVKANSDIKHSSDVLTRRKLKKLLHQGTIDNTPVHDSYKEQLELISKLGQVEKHDDGTDTTQSSQTSNTTSLGSSIVRQVQNDTWVQCENTSCLKWRRVPKLDAKKLDETSWFCKMNPDECHNFCEAAEEDYDVWERMIKKCGYKFIHSTLDEGTLVWAKMQGYCKWPAIVTRDPVGGAHVFSDTDGEPLSYHVEYLGKKHTHGWVQNQHVELYGEASKPQSSTTCTSSKKRRKTKHLTSVTQGLKPKDRQTYKRHNVDDAIQEITGLLNKSKDEKIKSCSFGFIPIASKREQTQANTEHLTHTEKQINTKSKTMLVRKLKQDEIMNNKNSMMDDIASDIGSPDVKLNQLSFNTSLVGRTKEEKFALDIEMYTRNEKAFEHDVRRFMDRNNRKISRLPCWQGINITLFQLFLAVYDRGGFKKVKSYKGGWQGVYNELTGMNSHAGGGNVAASYYTRNMLPYELYISGRNFKKHLKKSQPKAPKQRMKKTKEKAQIVPDGDVEFPLSDFEDLLDVEQELQGMLGDLDEADPLQTAGLAVSIKRTKGIPVAFYDDSPNEQTPSFQEANTASEFGPHAAMPEGEQEVPSGVIFSEEDNSHDTIEEDNSQDVQVFHEMQALEHEIDELNVDIDW
ncbi:unnamed protein product [Owenia fusiformis]|uniref:Uncharacterized protein n=1 Tax=Owenia fusiformis TaxID=6347 RepID=A0A8S4P6T3_OWEFU|nr:unnamed protein product [Owenia fusiformis]